MLRCIMAEAVPPGRAASRPLGGDERNYDTREFVRDHCAALNITAACARRITEESQERGGRADHETLRGSRRVQLIS